MALRFPSSVADSAAKTNQLTLPAPVEAATPAPAETAVTATSAPSGEAPTAAPVMAEALANLNLRDGPGTEYSLVDKFPAGSQIVIIGRNEDGSWLLGKTEKGEEVWLSGEASLIKVDPTQITKLTVAKAPPLPYNINNKQVNDVLNMIPLVVHHENKFGCGSHGGLNKLLPEVAEGNVIGPHANDFVYKGDNVLFKYTGGTFYQQTQYHIRITRLPGTPPGSSRLILDGQLLAGNTLPLLDDQRDHSVELQVGR